MFSVGKISALLVVCEIFPLIIASERLPGRSHPDGASIPYTRKRKPQHILVSMLFRTLLGNVFQYLTFQVPQVEKK